MTILFALVSGLMALWCFLHAAHVVYAAELISGPWMCAEAAHEFAASVGLPLEQTISLGLFTGGCTLVALIQTIRYANAGAFARGRNR